LIRWEEVLHIDGKGYWGGKKEEAKSPLSGKEKKKRERSTATTEEKEEARYFICTGNQGSPKNRLNSSI